jgi:hypothetical protein
MSSTRRSVAAEAMPALSANAIPSRQAVMRAMLCMTIVLTLLSPSLGSTIRAIAADRSSTPVPARAAAVL